MQLTPFLMLEGRAEEAMRLYASVVPGAEITKLETYGEDGPGPAGTVSAGELLVAGQRLRFFDSPVHHEFTFTPAISLFLDVDVPEQVDELAAALGEGGAFLMPVGDYGFSRRFAWLNDRFGVSWQLNAP